MKKIVRLTIIVGIIITLGFIILLVANDMLRIYLQTPRYGKIDIELEFTGFGREHLREVGTYSVSAEGINTVNVVWLSGAVYIDTHTGDEIVINEFAWNNLRDDQRLKFDVSDQTLEIQFTANAGARNMLPKQVEILIPYAFVQDFESFYINTTSGRVIVNNIQATDFIANTVSGRIQLKDIVAYNLSLSTTTTRSSGRIQVQNIISNVINISTGDGRIEVYDSKADEMFLRSWSRRVEATDIEVRSLYTRAHINRISGRINQVDVNGTLSPARYATIRSDIIPESVTVRTFNGIELVVPASDSAPISVQYSTTADGFMSEIPVISDAGENAQFYLNSRNGRILIRNIY